MEFNGATYNDGLANMAQANSWIALQAIGNKIETGMTEVEAERLAWEVLGRMGVRKMWHPVHIRFGKNTTKGYRDASEPDVTLQAEDIFFIDIGPVFDGHEGDCGYTFVRGENAELIDLARKPQQIWEELRWLWQNGFTGCQLMESARQLAQTMGVEIAPEYVKGHRICDFPHEIISKQKLYEFNSCPAPKRWVLEIQVIDRALNRGAFYEEILR